MGALHLPCLVLSLCMYETIGQVSLLQNKTSDKNGLVPSTPSDKSSNVLREILNQESLVRFSMVQKIQNLVMDAINNKNNREVMKTKLASLKNDLQYLEIKDQQIRVENVELKRELKILDEKLKQISDTLQVISEKNIVNRLAATEDTLNILSADVNKSLEKANEDLTELTLEWSQWTESRSLQRTGVVFTAVIKSTTSVGYTQPVVFPHVITNKGNAYNPSDGVFTAPINGTYVFFCSIMSEKSHNSWVNINKNRVSQVLIGARGDSKSMYSAASNMISLELIKGDRIWVAAFATSPQLYAENGIPIATFSGFLL